MRIFTVALLGLWLAGPCSLGAEEPFDRSAERARFLTAIENIEEPRLVIEGLETASPQVRPFLIYFRDYYWPMWRTLERLGFLVWSHHLAIDRALFDTEEEKKAWQTKEEEYCNAHDALETSERYKSVLRTMGAMGERLEGELAAHMVRKALLNRLQGFSAHERPLLARENNLVIRITEIANTLPLNDARDEETRILQAIDQDFHNGRISLTEAADRVRARISWGGMARGRQMAELAQQELNELAILRTRLVQAKGYSTYAQYKMAGQSVHNAPGFQTAPERVKFLKGYLERTLLIHQRILGERAAEYGLDLSQIDPIIESFLSFPGEARILRFLPAERIQEVWEEVMRESGFEDSTLSRIQWDSWPRPGKFTEAYMIRVRPAMPREFRVSASGLRVYRPPLGPESWIGATIHVIQNWLGEGFENYSTAFHEGGHGKDYGERIDPLLVEQGSAYTETHSFTDEAFMRDRDVLLAKLRTLEGEAITPDLVDQFLIDTGLNEAMSRRYMALYSLFDLLVWDHPYTEGGETFVERNARLWAELNQTYMPYSSPVEILGVDTRYVSFKTDHVWGGDVSTIGYDFAYIAADMTVEAIYDRLEAETGRRSLWRQPSLARLQIEGYYRNGFAMPFPRATEAFTGKPYDADGAADVLVQRAERLLDQYKSLRCAEKLTIPKDS